MGKVFERMDVINRADDRAAQAALSNQGITFVKPVPGEVERWRQISEQSVDEMVEQGVMSRDVVNQVRGHLQSFRASQ